MNSPAFGGTSNDVTAVLASRESVGKKRKEAVFYRFSLSFLSSLAACESESVHNC